MKQTAMISQPMKDISSDDILVTREKAINTLEQFGYDVVDNYFADFPDDGFVSDDTKNIPIAYLAKSIAIMAKCNAVYFCRGWETARGCKIEHEIANSYGLAVIYEE